MESFPLILRQLMNQNNISTKELADTLNLQIRNIQRYLKGEQIPPANKLIEIADFFDVSLDYLVGRSDDPKRY